MSTICIYKTAGLTCPSRIEKCCCSNVQLTDLSISIAFFSMPLPSLLLIFSFEPCMYTIHPFFPFNLSIHSLHPFFPPIHPPTHSFIHSFIHSSIHPSMWVNEWVGGCVGKCTNEWL